MKQINGHLSLPTLHGKVVNKFCRDVVRNHGGLLGVAQHQFRSTTHRLDYMKGFGNDSIVRTGIRIEPISLSSLSSSDETIQQCRKRLENNQDLLKQHATKITLSLYRVMVRSVRFIRHGNQYDEEEFARREEEEMEQLANQTITRKNVKELNNDPRLSMLSMLPPVNRVDELRSRAEYYMQYAHENFLQEKDCLDYYNGMLWDSENIIYRYKTSIRRGNEQRKWLLKDMKFEYDPYSHYGTILDEMLTEFEKAATEHIHEVQDFNNGQRHTTRDPFDMINKKGFGRDAVAQRRPIADIHYDDDSDDEDD